MNFSQPVPYPLITISAMIGLVLLLAIVFSVPSTAKPKKLKRRDNTEDK